MNSPETRLRFGSFELDVRSRELRNGSARALQEQPFEIRIMLDRAGEVVTRESCVAGCGRGDVRRFRAQPECGGEAFAPRLAMTLTARASSRRGGATGSSPR
jgi:hypothetical protein